MIPTYEGAQLAETLRSVLCQDPGSQHMQIEVVDDHSTTVDTAAVVADVGGDRVGYHRQAANRGYVANFATCLRRARGHLVHLLHDDDLVLEGFYEALAHGFDERPDVGAAFSRHLYADAAGHWQSLSPLERPDPGVIPNWLAKIAAGQRLAAPSVVVRRAVYERLGGFDRRFSVAGEDWEMWVRIAAHYPVWFEPRPLAVYRMKSPGSLTAESARTGALVADMRLATDIVAEYLDEHLPPAAARRALGHARDFYARWAIEAARQAAADGSGAAAWHHAQVALRTSRTPRIAAAVAGALTAGWLRAGRRSARRVVGRRSARQGGGRRSARPGGGRRTNG